MTKLRKWIIALVIVVLAAAAVLIGIQQLVNRNPKSTRHEYNEPVLNPAKWTGDNRGGKKLMEYELLPDDLLVVIASN